MDAVISVDALLVSFIAAGSTVLLLIAVVILAVRQRKLLSRYRLILQGSTGQDLEQLLLGQAATLESLQTEVNRLNGQIHTLQEAAKLHVQKTAIVRFNAFPDTGSDLSFAIALLDANDNGMVISSLYGRSESRTYAKPIRSGQSTYQLSTEEKAALAQAQERKA